MNRHSVYDDNGALEELRRHVSQRILETCLKKELEGHADGAAYFEALTKIGRILTDLKNDQHEVVRCFSSFKDTAAVVVELLRRANNDISIVSNILDVSFDSVEFSVLTNVSLELILNSLRHAFPNGRSGYITISLKETNEGKDLELLVSDNGCGPRDIVFGQGLRLAARLSTVLCGDITIRHHDGGGTGVALTFPYKNSKR
jgi:two-component sensor histidine kinase